MFVQASINHIKDRIWEKFVDKETNVLKDFCEAILYLTSMDIPNFVKVCAIYSIFEDTRISIHHLNIKSIKSSIKEESIVDFCDKFLEEIDHRNINEQAIDDFLMEYGETTKEIDGSAMQVLRAMVDVLRGREAKSDDICLPFLILPQDPVHQEHIFSEMVRIFRESSEKLVKRTTV